jgi:hypothetical protein
MGPRRVSFCLFSSCSIPYLCAMENKAAVRAFLPITIIFLVTSAFFIVGRSLLTQWGADTDLLIMGNLLLVLLTVFSFYQHIRALRNKNIHAFLRVLKGSVLIKMMVCGVAAFIYITTAGKAVNTGGVLGFMLLYFVYTLTEAAIVMKLSKQNKNA